MNREDIINNALDYNQEILLTHQEDLTSPTIVIKTFDDFKSLKDIDLNDYNISIFKPSEPYLKSILPNDNIIKVGSHGELIRMTEYPHYLVVRSNDRDREFYLEDRGKNAITFTDEYNNKNIYKAVLAFREGFKILVNGHPVKYIEENFSNGSHDIFQLYNGDTLKTNRYLEDIVITDELRKEVINEREIKSSISKTIFLTNKENCYEVFGKVRDSDTCVKLLDKKTLDIISIDFKDLYDYDIILKN